MGRQDILTDDDLRSIAKYGLTTAEVFRQLDLFKMPPPYLKLVRPCTRGDGIKFVKKEQLQALVETYEEESPKRRCLKFVPASGAASRMFKILLGELNKEKEILRKHVEKEVQAGQKSRQELLEFMVRARDFAFFEDLKSLMSKNGIQIETLLREGRFADIMRSLLGKLGLNYANMPKGLLKFHQYADGSRTAFEEHLVEAAFYIAAQDGQCHLHFTVSPEHMENFRSLFLRIKPLYEQKCQVSFRITFSVQKKSADTIAVDLDNNPFRDEKGGLLFRPGGHGSLIENVNDLDGDIVFIKNIDNVVPDRLKVETYKWKKILGGYLISLQNQLFSYMEKLSSGISDDSFFNEVTAFIKDELSLPVPLVTEKASPEKKKAFLMKSLNRPLRICGMVKNAGEPGGGPFWVRDSSGGITPQIVETAQVNPDSKEQQSILASSTHFNPVDLVCGIRDWQEMPFDLRQYVDEKAVFISKKSKDGQELKALEHPGLWNGAMAQWITLFVEVPIITFNPVKTVNDLLREEHQPG